MAAVQLSLAEIKTLQSDGHVEVEDSQGGCIDVYLADDPEVVASTLPERRLDHVGKLQWELDAWLQHALDWQRTMGGDAQLQKQIDAFDTCGAALFEAFSQPAKEHKA